MTAVLGLSCFYHDSAAALVVGSELVAAAQQERFSRVKHDSLFPIDAVRFCLAQRGLQLSELDAVVFYEEPEQKLFRILQTIGQAHPNRRSFLARVLPEWLEQPGLVRKRLLNGLRRIDPGFDEARLRYTQHHRSHAASAFFPSPFSSAAILTMDGVGEFATTSIQVGRDSEIRLLRQIEFPHSLGLLYAAFTAYLGFKVNDGEYKVMGLAPYGQPRFLEQFKRELIAIRADGSFRINQDYFDLFTADRMFNDRLSTLLGHPSRTDKEAPLTQFHMDVAASVQAATTEAVLALARAAVEETGVRDLCLAGGVALNCVASGHLLRSGIARRLWIQPAAGDAGGAVGAAFVGAVEADRRPARMPMARRIAAGLGRIKRRLATPRRDTDRMQGGYLGPEFPQHHIESYLSSIGATFDVAEDDERLIATTLGHLTADRVVGWYQGRMEFGPRALGNRSILADPRSPAMQRTLNAKIKNRESFRPFAPAVTVEACREWFSFDHSPYMLLIGDVLEQHRLSDVAEAEGLAKLDCHRSIIPAVTHVDNSARVQTVDKAVNPLFHRLLSAFGTATGVPILVNTSFNVSDEPIVCTPEDAYRCFLAAQIDVLVMGRCILQRDRQQVTLPAFLEVPETGTFEIESQYCAQWYAGGHMHFLRNRFYQTVMSRADLHQQVPTTEYETTEGWWAALRMACHNRFVVICCGGSTTAFNTNWPFFLEAELNKAGAGRPVITINIGQPRCSSFDLYFLLDRFLCDAEEFGIRPNLVLSLDGLNDLGYRIQAFLLTLRHGNSDAYCTNEVRLLDQLARRRKYPNASAGAYHAILTQRSDDVSSLTQVPLPRELEDEIVECFATTLEAFRGLCRSHGLRCMNFLQPPLLERSGHHRAMQLRSKLQKEVEDLKRAAAADGTTISDEAAFDAVRKRHNIRLHIGEGAAIGGVAEIRGPYVFDWAPIYAKCSRLWSKLQHQEKQVDFVDLSAIFAEETDEVFRLDAVHYTLAGSRKLAAAIAGAVSASVVDGTASDEQPIAPESDSELRAIWARLRDAGLDAAIAEVESSARRGTPPPTRELQALLAAQGRVSEAAALGTPVSNPPRRRRVDDVLDAILERCSTQAERDPVPESHTGWKMPTHPSGLSRDEAAAWASLAAELYRMAASAEPTTRSYDWETERGELYPLY